MLRSFKEVFSFACVLDMFCMSGEVSLAMIYYVNIKNYDELSYNVVIAVKVLTKQTYGKTV